MHAYFYKDHDRWIVCQRKPNTFGTKPQDFVKHSEHLHRSEAAAAAAKLSAIYDVTKTPNE